MKLVNFLEEILVEIKDLDPLIFMNCLWIFEKKKINKIKHIIMFSRSFLDDNKHINLFEFIIKKICYFRNKNMIY
ncbi:LOW QUALITY PROTEIN: uncharacterized protein T551_01002 [Pneumocystis jirovecii RU7]|uniref:Uncharacterized protein n=1 Tax=Pneumocystis jirovecii (strain RU7) TaxID=1408657 RepID=A0A0W4ZTQ5_PNEJ7|nr:LOW QUALITY PROTEIN: uncharacterized protein T551_01002 [Pneumocystis jirovecii RU7]KTW31741.1 LOW QUALITY PROTEIN: hypothetical protein T551_01002 [Pneumocystis jirovecii RU7]